MTDQERLEDCREYFDFLKDFFDKSAGGSLNMYDITERADWLIKKVDEMAEKLGGL